MTTEVSNAISTDQKWLDLHANERTAHCNLLVARDNWREAQQLEKAIFEAWLAASKATSCASKREDVAFDAWYAAAKSLDEARCSLVH